MPTERPPRDRVALGRLLTLLGLTGFAISQPLLAIAGEDPTLFTFAGVDGGGLVAFALLVAFGPPLALWAVVAALGRANTRAGDLAYLACVAVLAGAAVAQWAWAAGLDRRLLRLPVAVLAGIAVAALIARIAVVAEWTRYTAVLPPLSVFLLLAASPSSALLSSPEEATAVGDSGLPSVVFILLDELPLESLLADDGSIDAVRFPNLAALAAGSTWYRDYTVLANGTHQSVPAVLSGLEPAGGRPIWTDHPDNLFSLLAPTHDLTVSETATKLCGFANCELEGAEHAAERGISSVLSQVADVWQQRIGLEPERGADLGQFEDELVPLDPDDVQPESAPDVVARPAAVADFVDALGTGRSPTLELLHVMLPHQPWVRTPEGEPLISLDQFGLALFEEPDPWELALLEQAHLFQLQYTDRLVGEIIDRLRALDRYDSSLIVVTSDHGVDFGGPILRALDEDTIADIAFVPLLVKAPGQQEGVVDDSNVDALDLLPTIADLVGVEVPWPHDGLPAGSPAIADRGDRKRIIDFGDEFGQRPLEELEFDVDEHRPSAARRHVAGVGPDDHALAGLLRSIDADGWLGADADEVSTGPAGATRAVTLERSGQGDGGLVAGRLGGRLDEDAGATAGDVVLLAVDGVVETASPVMDGGRIALFVPPDAASEGEVELRAFLVRGDDVAELAIREA